jgi:hypothetical protein
MSQSHATIENRTVRDNPWQGPYDERNRLGKKTGARFVRCCHCGIEVLVRDCGDATHREACPHAE